MTIAHPVIDGLYKKKNQSDYFYVLSTYHVDAIFF
jgi:hypothetical protein